MGDVMKTCTRCGETKDLVEFCRRSSNLDGRDTQCKVCKNALYHVWREENQHKAIAASRAWRLANVEKLKEHEKTRWASNTDRESARHKAWAHANPEKKRQGVTAWAKANPDRIKAIAIKRKAMERQATPAWADMKAMKAIYKQASDMTKLIGESYHVDHIVPLISKLVCGLHWEMNLQVVTEDVNRSKGNRWWPDMPDKESADSNTGLAATVA